MATSKMTIGTLQHLKVQKLYNIKIIVSALHYRCYCATEWGYIPSLPGHVGGEDLFSFHAIWERG